MDDDAQPFTLSIPRNPSPHPSGPGFASRACTSPSSGDPLGLALAPHAHSSCSFLSLPSLIRQSLSLLTSALPASLLVLSTSVISAFQPPLSQPHSFHPPISLLQLETKLLQSINCISALLFH
jgi:hypothetical protein